MPQPSALCICSISFLIFWASNARDRVFSCLYRALLTTDSKFWLLASRRQLQENEVESSFASTERSQCSRNLDIALRKILSITGALGKGIPKREHLLHLKTYCLAQASLWNSATCHRTDSQKVNTKRNAIVYSRACIKTRRDISDVGPKYRNCKTELIVF